MALPTPAPLTPDLQAQVRMLSDKLARAADRIADLEDELNEYRPRPNRISALFGRRRSINALPLPTTDSTDSLLEAERGARRAAEARLAAVTAELEELSQSLFEEANSMVSSERRARSRVEERLREMELREEEKKVRLGELEQAVGRIGRVREMLRPSTAD
ncbi:Rab guanine nucleotide exchange factor SEC2 [Neolecta irregularis DAH-3]|uniref:Rab guanine nucleotide exchange factor SEC2 n=1 Tax=Neolecta irregularis (strain DAH-3) TaxID=1198029 RepID=A0A1U7LWJ1_NEOID|nr:Rab guanine nucleotide exchange factor SEC2 [Neolecta irregularis DAH-3]|eukprot:OLL27037.1 Rab guanine nucleotide exchange factor SEC2 [Neolecta irregularis DAH-3]